MLCWRSFTTAACRYLSNAREALRHLNVARRDMRWSAPALLAMAEIYINPEHDISWFDADGDGVGVASGAGAAADAQPGGAAHEAVQAASKLLQQLRPSDMQSSRYKVWQGCWAQAVLHSACARQADASARPVCVHRCCQRTRSWRARHATTSRLPWPSCWTWPVLTPAACPC